MHALRVFIKQKLPHICLGIIATIQVNTCFGHSFRGKVLNASMYNTNPHKTYNRVHIDNAAGRASNKGGQKQY